MNDSYRWLVRLCAQWQRRVISHQDCYAARAIHLRFDEERVESFKKLRMMFEVSRSGLHRFDRMLLGKAVAIEAGSADQ